MSTPALKSCLNILRRTPPEDTEENLKHLANLLSPNEDAIDELYQRVDAPLKEALDPLADNRPYLLCDHNRDGDSYRSPYSNTYHPPLEDGGFKPSNKLRSLEIQFNEVFDTYTKHYYGKDHNSAALCSSVYLWDKENEESEGKEEDLSSFAGCFLIQKAIKEENNDENLREGYWNSVHVVDVGLTKSGGEKGGGEDDDENTKPILKTTYKLTTTILISMKPTTSSQLDKTNISGSLTRQHERSYPYNSSSSAADITAAHIVNIGNMIEDMEIEMRSNMDSLYISKTQEIVDVIRKPSVVGITEGQQHTMMLNKVIEERGIAK